MLPQLVGRETSIPRHNGGRQQLNRCTAEVIS
nr:MAG TPA: hypothetical protein [Caudoviricetes sp.]